MVTLLVVILGLRCCAVEDIGVEIPENVEVGDCFEGERKRFSISIRNTTAEAKSIDRVFFTCGSCFENDDSGESGTPSLDSFPIAVKPLQTLEFRAVFNSYKLAGKASKAIWVYAEDTILSGSTEANSTLRPSIRNSAPSLLSARAQIRSA